MLFNYYALVGLFSFLWALLSCLVKINIEFWKAISVRFFFFFFVLWLLSIAIILCSREMYHRLVFWSRAWCKLFLFLWLGSKQISWYYIVHSMTFSLWLRNSQSVCYIIVVIRRFVGVVRWSLKPYSFATYCASDFGTFVMVVVY